MRALLALGLVGCYSPHLEDCQVRCGAEQACPADLECQAGSCRAPGAAGTCPELADGAITPADGAVTPGDAASGADSEGAADASRRDAGQADAGASPDGASPADAGGGDAAACSPLLCNCSGWQTEVVAPWAWSSSLRIDPGDRLHLVYSDYDQIVYETRTGSGDWEATPLQTLGTSAADVLSLALDPSGYPHVLYSIGDMDGLTHAWQDAGGWTNEPVGSGKDPSFAIDASGRLHIAYQSAAGAILYRSRDGGTWGAEEVVAPVDPSIAEVHGDHPALAVDAAGEVHVIFHTNWVYQSSDLYYSVRDTAGTWSGGIWANFSAEYYDAGPYGIAAGPDGTLYAAWADIDSYRWLWTSARPPGGDWSSPEILQRDTIGDGLAIASTASGDFYLAHYLRTDNLGVDFQVGHDQAGSWSVDPAIGPGASSSNAITSLALDGAGELHAVYNGHNGLDGELVYARRCP